MALNTVTLGGFSVYDPPPGVSSNSMLSTSGASRYAVGRFLMRSDDYLLLSQQNSGVAQLVIKGDPGPGVTISVIIAGAVNAIAAVAPDGVQGSSPNDLVHVIVYDKRVRNFGPLAKAYNVPQQTPQGFHLTSGDFDCYSSTKNSGSLWTWQQIHSDIQLTNAPSDLPSWKPYGLIYDQVPRARIWDDFAARLFYVCAYDWTSDTVRLFKPTDGFDGNDSLFSEALSQAFIGGGDGQRNQFRMPNKFEATFKAIDQDNLGDPFKNRVYKKVLNSGSGPQGSDFRQPLHIGEILAAYSGGAWANQSTLDEIAQDMADRAGAFMQLPFGTYEFAGAWPFMPDGYYRSVEWISTAAGTKTIVRLHNQRDFSAPDALGGPMELPANQEVFGFGAVNTSITQPGTKNVWQLPTICVTFKVNLTQDGGGTSAPTYTVTDCSGNSIGTTGMSPEATLRFGDTIAADIGIGYYDQDGTFHLLYAFEQPGQATCPTAP